MKFERISPQTGDFAGDFLAEEVTSEDLLQGKPTLRIRHGDAVYTLRLTRQDKLLLTK